MKVVCLQLETAWEDKAANHLKVRELLDASAPTRGSLVVLPEMFATGFSMNVANVSDTDSRETHDFLSRAASEHQVYLAGGVVQTARDGRGRNECAVFSPDGAEVTRYCKMHPFTYAGESEHYASGDDIRLFDWHGLAVTPFICYDLRFPEIFRAAVVRGAELFVVIANWPTPRTHHWVTLLEARAIENQAYVVGVNRCGSDPKLSYSGRSMVIDPRGRVLADAGEQEGTVSAEIDAEEVRSYRREFPALEDIRGGYVKAAG
jgi:predicted amidohydrolase